MSTTLSTPTQTQSLDPTLPLYVAPTERQSEFVEENEKLPNQPTTTATGVHHAKEGTLTEKFNILTEATQQKLEPAIKFIEESAEKLVKKMPESVSHYHVTMRKIMQFMQKISNKKKFNRIKQAEN